MKWLMVFCLCIFSDSVFARGGGAVETNRKGVYWVPVDPKDIQYSIFVLQDVELKERGGSIKVEYDLPLELTGSLNRIELTGVRPTSGPMVLRGPNASAECPSANEINRCRITYNDLVFDVDARNTLLKSIALSPDELLSRTAVAESFQFGGEPGGFLSLL